MYAPPPPVYCLACRQWIAPTSNQAQHEMTNYHKSNAAAAAAAAEKKEPVKR